MKKKIVLLVLLFAASAQSQNIQQIDSLNTEICKSIDKLESIDEKKFQLVLQKHMPEFFDRYKIDSRAKADSLMDLVYFRLQKSCNSFLVLLSKLEENKSDWAMQKTQPKTEISESDLTQFFKAKSFHYKEYDGKIVTVKLDANIWNEKFEDGTFSKLNFVKTSGSTFTLKFIESNNGMRKNLSVKGEEYQYGIYGKGENCYLAWTSSKEGDFYTFKLYLN